MAAPTVTQALRTIAPPIAQRNLNIATRNTEIANELLRLNALSPSQAGAGNGGIGNSPSAEIGASLDVLG